jgi:hypothetical protein
LAHVLLERDGCATSGLNRGLSSGSFVSRLFVALLAVHRCVVRCALCVVRWNVAETVSTEGEFYLFTGSFTIYVVLCDFVVGVGSVSR